MDETPLAGDMVTSRSYAKKGTKQVAAKTGGRDRDNTTVVLTCTKSGRMLKPMGIFKGMGLLNCFNANCRHTKPKSSQAAAPAI
jgi:hypothetical protein